MTFAITLLSLVVAGAAVLRILRLTTGDRAVDLALAWLVGSGWLAAVAPVVRFGLGVPLGRLTVAAVVLAPVVGWAAIRGRARRRSAVGEEAPQARADAAPGLALRLPRPLWAFAPLALYVAVVTSAVLLHGINTPTHTDDGIRVRAFAPMLAFSDAWATDERGVFSMAGPLPTFVPALGWIVSGTLDHFHVNYAVLAELVALLVLVVGLGHVRGSPERGWASAFAVLSIPLFVYHCTSTYSDAVLAMRVAGGLAFFLEHARTGELADAGRALLLFGLAALVKREGEIVAAAPTAVLLAQLAWERRAAFPWRLAALAAAPFVLGAIGKIAAVGLANAFPMLQLVVHKASLASDPAATAPPGRPEATPGGMFVYAMFRAGDHGMIFWLLGGAIAVRATALERTRRLWPLLAVVALLVLVTVSSILVIPEFTLDGTTVHRALLVASVPAALWTAAVVVDAASEAAPDAAPERSERAEGPARKGKGKRRRSPR
jgi:hypothetical protein